MESGDYPQIIAKNGFFYNVFGFSIDILPVTN
jgi:hypothetical protein